MPRAKRTKRDNSTPGPKPRGAVAAPAGTVKPPRGLSTEARRLWRRLAPELERAELLARSDELTLALACEVGAFALSAAAELHEHGLTETDEAHKGTLRRSPNWTVFQQACQAWNAYADRLGLSPRARQALPAADSAGNEFEAFLRRGVEMRRRREAETSSPAAEADDW